MENNNNSNKMDLSFSGAGFMGCYYFGVVDCWNKYIPRERVNRVAGASAGSLIAAYYLCDLPLGDVLREIIGLTEDIRRRPLGVFDRSHQIVDILPKILDRLFPDDAHKRVSGRLHVCMTRLKDMKKIIVSEFETKKDLLDALNCSCFIPVWSGNHVSTYKGVKHIDGGFTDNLPVFDEHTIRICCFSGASDISPYDRAKMELLSGKVLNTPLYWNFANMRRFGKALFPPSASFIVDLLERGFHDTKDFILSNDLIQCDHCYAKTRPQDQPIYQRVSPMITPSVSPAISRAGSFRVLNASADRNNNNNNSKVNISKRDKSFDALVSEKLLRSCSSTIDDDADNYIQQTPIIVINGDVSLSSPDIDSISAGSSSQDSDDSGGSDGLAATTNQVSYSKSVCKVASGNSPHCGNKRAVPKDQQVPPSANARRRSTLHYESSPPFKGTTNSSSGNEPLFNSAGESLLVMRDRFTLAPSPLPSCPPSPNLNRHCTECIRLRQEARMDAIEKEIRHVAEQFVPAEAREPKVGGLKSKLASPLRWIRMLGTKSSYKFQSNDSPPSHDRLQSPV